MSVRAWTGICLALVVIQVWVGPARGDDLDDYLKRKKQEIDDLRSGKGRTLQEVLDEMSRQNRERREAPPVSAGATSTQAAGISQVLPTTTKFYGDEDDPGPSLIARSGKRVLALQVQWDSEQPSVPRGYVADVTHSLDIRGQSFPLKNDVDIKFNLHDVGYRVQVSAERVEEPGGSYRDDWRVTLRRGWRTVAQTTLYGPDGLLARKLRYVRRNGGTADLDADGKYYMDLQGGANVSWVFFPLGELDRALSEGSFRPGSTPRPSQVVLVRRGGNGSSEPLPGGGEILRLGKGYYRFSPESDGFLLRRLTDEELDELLEEN